jgi:DNA-binding winged helix-turn-helix (wHTH) protein
VPSSVYKFGDFELDPSRFELKRNGRVQKLERIPMDLLILLAEKDGNVATRQEIVERLWGKDVFVDTEHGINTAIRKIRQVLRDDPEEPQFILTVTGKGYRFVPLVVRISGGNGSAAVASTLLPGVEHSLTEPSIEPAEKTGVATPRPVAARHRSLFLLGSLGVIAFAV